MSLRILALGGALLLAGCATQVPSESVAVPVPSVEADPLRCSTRADCTTKVSRTLLFVFDYAAAGGHLVQRQGRQLFTPAEAVPNDWPALSIHLAEPVDSHFEFNAVCRLPACRYSSEQLLRVYRSYLADRPCSLVLDSAVEACR